MRWDATTATALPTANAAVVLVVGASETGAGFVFTKLGKNQSLCSTRSESRLPAIAINSQPFLRGVGTMFNNSADVPLCDMRNTRSSEVTFVRFSEFAPVRPK